MPKRGRLSEADQDFIKQNAGRLSDEQIANRLDRAVPYIRTFIRGNCKPVAPPDPSKPPPTIKPLIDDATQVAVRQELRTSVKWERMKQELTKDELKFFEEEYVNLMAQFRSDVLATEENQIFDAIKFEVLKSRNMVARRKALEDITRLERMQESFLATFGRPKDMTEDDRTYALNLESQLNVARSNEQSRTNEYVKLQERVDKLMQSLKATRDQRVTKFEDSKVSFVGVLKMLQEKDIQDAEGRQIGLMKLAAQKEYERLGRPHKYEDNNEDSPILSADTVDLGPEEDV